MRAGKFRLIGDAVAGQAGDSELIIRRHYPNVITLREAGAFFSIMPKKAPGDVIRATAFYGKICGMMN
jgi:hypothetical protein